MLLPIVPLSAAPVTSQHDPVKPTPDIPPVVPAQPASSDGTNGTIDLRHQRDPEEQAYLLREEQRRQQQRREQRRQDDQTDLYSAMPPISTVPCQAMNSTPTIPCRSRRWVSAPGKACWWISRSEDTCVQCLS